MRNPPLRIAAFATIVAALGLSPLAAQATTLTFDSSQSGVTLSTYQGFQFTNPTYGWPGMVAAISGPLNEYNVIDSYGFTMSEVSGGTFSLQDFYVKAQAASALSTTMYGYLAGKQVSSVTFADSGTWHDIVANFSLVDSVTFSSIYTASTYLLFDNITVNAATAAPEPASMALLGVGLIGTAVMARRRRPSAKAPTAG